MSPDPGCFFAAKLALDLSPFGIVPDSIDAMQQASLGPLYNSEDKLNNVENAVDPIDKADKAVHALRTALPFLGPVAKNSVGVVISVFKAGQDYHECTR